MSRSSQFFWGRKRGHSTFSLPSAGGRGDATSILALIGVRTASHAGCCGGSLRPRPLSVARSRPTSNFAGGWHCSGWHCRAARQCEAGTRSPSPTSRKGLLARRGADDTPAISIRRHPEAGLPPARIRASTFFGVWDMDKNILMRRMTARDIVLRLVFDK